MERFMNFYWDCSRLSSELELRLLSVSAAASEADTPSCHTRLLAAAGVMRFDGTNCKGTHPQETSRKWKLHDIFGKNL